MTPLCFSAVCSTNPINELVDRRSQSWPELSDVPSIVQVKSTMGQATCLEYPKLHELAASDILWFALSMIFWCALIRNRTGALF